MSEQSKKKVAIVGCGVGGMTAIKSCLEEGLQPYCFEMNSDVGGVWYTPDSQKNGSGAQMYNSLITNSSKAMIAFSDFPCPPSYPPYLPHPIYQLYLQSYAEHFGLLQYVSFNTKVLEVRKTDDYTVTGRWVVTTCNTQAGIDSEEKTASEIYDGVILCQGFCSIPHFPDIPGLSEGYQGRVTHVNNYRDPQLFKGKTVVVVGSGSSAGDVACDIAPLAKQVYLIVHRGAYIFSRLHNGLKPLDFRLNRMVLNYMPRWLLHRTFFSSATKCLNPSTSGLQTSASLPDPWASVMISDQLPSKIFTGQVKVMSEIQRVTDTGDLHLKDDKVLTNVDDIVFATGYRYKFKVIDPSLLTSDTESGKLDLYKMVFPTSLPHDTLAVVGCLRAFGPMPPIIEVQARLAARVFAGRHRLPDRTTRQRDVDHMNQQQLQDHGCYRYSFVSLAMSDNVAAELGVRPDLWRLLLQGDLQMALAVMCGPSYPFHYRLVGPHRWAGAREATRMAYKDTVYSVQHRRVGSEEGGKVGNVWGYACLLSLVLVLAVAVYCCC